MCFTLHEPTEQHPGTKPWIHGNNGNQNSALEICQSLDSAATNIPAHPPALQHALRWKSSPSHQGFHQLPKNGHRSVLWKDPHKTGRRRKRKTGNRSLMNTSKGSGPLIISPLLSTAWNVLQLLYSHQRQYYSLLPPDYLKLKPQRKKKQL